MILKARHIYMHQLLSLTSNRFYNLFMNGWQFIQYIIQIIISGSLSLLWKKLIVIFSKKLLICILFMFIWNIHDFSQSPNRNVFDNIIYTYFNKFHPKLLLFILLFCRYKRQVWMHQNDFVKHKILSTGYQKHVCHITPSSTTDFYACYTSIQ